MTDSQPPREYLQLAHYPVHGYVHSTTDNTVEKIHNHRTVLWVNLVNLHTDQPTPIGVQFHIDSNTTTGGYITFESEPELTDLSHYISSLSMTTTTPPPESIPGRGEVIHPHILSPADTELHPSPDNRTDVTLTFTPIRSQSRTGVTLSLSSDGTTGAEITLTPAQTIHLTKILSGVLKGNREFKSPQTTDRAIVEPDGQQTKHTQSAFTRRNND